MIQTLWHSGKGKTIETVKGSVVSKCPGEGGGKRMNRWRAQTIFREVKLLCMIPECWIHDIMHLLKPIELCNTKSEPQCKLWVLVNNNISVLVISCNKCTTLMQDVNNRKKLCCVGKRGIWEVSVLLVQFFFINLKLFLKSLLIKKKKRGYSRGEKKEIQSTRKYGNYGWENYQ